MMAAGWGAPFVLALLLMLPLSASALEMLPSNVVNVALPDFGDRIGGGNDYGLANLIPIEIVGDRGGSETIRAVRTPRELRLSKDRNEALFTVTLGKTDVIYYWIETPKVYGKWNLTLTLIYPDQYRRTFFSRDIQPSVGHFSYVDPATVLEVKIKSVGRTFKLSKKFFFTVSPARFVTWPEFFPMPYRRIYE